MYKNKLTLPISIILGVVILGGFYLSAQIIKQKSIEKQQLIKIQADSKIEELKLETEKTDSDVKIQQAQIESDAKLKADELKAEQTKAAQNLQQITEVKNKEAEQQALKVLNDCIASAKKERDRRFENLTYVWTLCLQNEFNVTNGICDDLNKSIENESKPAVTRKYNEWVEECKRGVKPDLTEKAN